MRVLFEIKEISKNTKLKIENNALSKIIYIFKRIFLANLHVLYLTNYSSLSNTPISLVRIFFSLNRD